MRTRRFLGLPLLAALALAALPAPASAAGAARGETGAEAYTPVSCENEFYRLDVSEEDGRFTLTGQKTGEKIPSYPDGLGDDPAVKGASRVRIRSALAATFFNTGTEAKTTLYSMSDAVSQDGLKVTESDREIVAEYTFASEGVTIPVHYTLDGPRLVVSVVTGEIKEKADSLLMELSVHPYFYSGSGAEDGYLLVPDGSGAVIRFNNGKYTAAPYRQKVYGRDLSLFMYSDVEYTNPVLMPLFGVSKRGGMALGVITAGAGDAYVEASPGVGNVGYNCAYATFSLLAEDMVSYSADNRQDVFVYPEKRNDAKLLQVTYSFGAGEIPGYVEMAGLYRGFLIEAYGLKRVETREVPLYLDIYMAAMRKKSFLGVAYVGVERLSTFRQVQTLVGELQAQGVGVTVRLHNWSPQTVRGKPLKAAGILPAAGSKKDLLSLKRTVEKSGRLYLDGNISEVYGGGFFARSFSYAKNMRKATLEVQHFNLATNFNTDEVHYLLSHKNILKNTEKFGASLSKLGFDTVGVSGLDRMFTDYGAENASMSGTAAVYEEALSKLRERGLSAAVTGGPQFALSAAPLILGMPSGDSMFEICDEAVPFYAAALHGYVPFALEPVNACADPARAYLKALETGSGLHYRWILGDPEKARYSRSDELYSGDAHAWKAQAAEKYREYADFLRDKADKTITGHERLAEGVYKTTFEGGGYVIVNYGSGDAAAQGETVGALSAVFGKDVG